MKREFLQNLKVDGQSLPKEIIDAIMEENGRDVQAGKTWQEKYNQALAQHQQQLQDVTFQSLLDGAIVRAKGRSAKAIAALLDLPTLKGSEDPQKAVEQALENLKSENGYLFEQPAAPPYARGTGAQTAAHTDTPATLADALRERYEGK